MISSTLHRGACKLQSNGAIELSPRRTSPLDYLQTQLLAAKFQFFILYHHTNGVPTRTIGSFQTSSLASTCPSQHGEMAAMDKKIFLYSPRNGISICAKDSHSRIILSISFISFAVTSSRLDSFSLHSIVLSIAFETFSNFLR